jgi:hypothetical protein
MPSQARSLQKQTKTRRNRSTDFSAGGGGWVLSPRLTPPYSENQKKDKKRKKNRRQN